MKAIILLLALLGADPQVKTLSGNDLNRLATLRENIDLLRRLETNGVNADKDGVITKSLLEEAHQIGGVSTYEELFKITGGENALPSVTQRSKSFLTLTNVLGVIGAMIFGSAVIFLFGHYFIDMILAISIEAWEVILWVVSIGLSFVATLVSIDWQLLVLILVCLLSTVAAGLGTSSRRLRAHRLRHEGEECKTRYEIIFSILAVFWGALAVYFGSHVVGFLSIMALLSAFGFICGYFPGCAYLGFEKYDVVSRATIAAAGILFVHVLLIVTGTDAPSIAVFREGMSFMGSMVYFVGILIMSSKYYCYDSYSYSSTRGFNWNKFWLMQVLTVVSGLLALYFGSVFGITALANIGGSFFCMYIIEKYFDIPWKGVWLYWGFMGFGLLLYVLSVVAKTYPQYFLFS